MAGGVNIYSYCGNGTLYKNDSSGYGPIPSWVQACFGGALGNALGSIWDVIRGRPGDQAAKSGACSVIFGCIISALIWWLINAATSGGDTASEGAVSGCLAGAASSFVATLCASQFCHERINWLCTILSMVAACLGGILGGWGSFAKDKILQGIGWAFTIGGVGLRIAMLAVLQNRMVCQKLNST